MPDTRVDPPVRKTQSDSKITYKRFDISQRLEHIIFLLSFSILGLTGLIQKFSTNQVADSIIYILGGIQRTRIIHHYSAIVMMIVSGYHVIALGYKVFVLRVRWTMLPVIEDFQHLIQDIAYFLGFRKQRAYYGRYNYAEKVEYLAVVWGTIIMGLTGFMMWNPITTTDYLPGDIIPAAKAAHGAEAILAVLAIIVWHFYYVIFNPDIYPLNTSMVNGNLTEKEFRHEYTGEWKQLQEAAEKSVTTGEEI